MPTRQAIHTIKDAISHVDLDEVTEHAKTGLDRLKDLPQNVGDDEKRLSLIGGGALGLIGLTRLNKASGWLMLGVGAALLFRGSTGHCGLYSSLGVDTSKK